MSKKKTTVKKVESGTEFVTKRTQTVWNTEGGSIVSDGTTGQKKIQITSEGGGNINLNSKVNSEFAPNNKQTLVHGDQFSTTAGDSFENVKSNKEQRVEGDLTIITGNENFFTDPTAEEWIEKNQEIAAAKAAPEYNYGAVGNNTETEYADGGTVGEGGAVEGGNYTPSEAHADIPALMEAKAADIAATEAKMGAGGNIKMMSAKHISLMAGTKAVTFDSGVMVPNARKVVKQYEVDGGECKPIYTAVSTYESKDTSGSVPFGDVHVSAATKLRVVTGSGGVSIKSAGEVNINSTGRLMLGGSEVAIGGSNKSNSGRVTMISDTDMFQEAGVIATRVAPNINDIASTQHSFHTPKGVFTGDLHIKGNVTVEGPNGIVVPAGDVLAGSVSLKNHTHGGVEPGSGSTSAPNGSGSSSGGGGGGGGGAVNKIIAGTNVTISPSTGIGDVTINATGGSSDFSGSYNDLTDVPTTFNTISSFSGSYNDLTDQPTILDSVAVLGVVAAAGYTTCEGDITGVTAGGYLTGGATSGDATIGLDSACASKWDNASAGGVANVTATAPLSSTGGTAPGISLDTACTTNWNTAYTDSQDTKTCPGLDCIGTLVASDITGLTDCLGTVTGSTAGALLSTNNNSTCLEFGINSGALGYLDQSACAGLDCTGTVVAGDIAGLTDCVGTVTCVSTIGDYLTGGGTTAFNIGIDSACASKWDSAAAGGLTGLSLIGGLTGTSLTGGTACVGVDAALVNTLNQSSCPGLDKVGTVTGSTAGALLSTNNNSTCLEFGINAGALNYLNQSACVGLNCVGDICEVTTGSLLSGGGSSGSFNIGIDSGALTYLDQSSCLGIDCVGDITAVCTTTLLSGGATSGAATIGINSGALDYLNQSACPGIDCIGTIEGITTTGDYLTGGGTSGCFNVGLDSACAAKWDNASAGGVTNVTGGDGITSSGGTTPEIAVDSSVARTDVAETFQNNVTVQGELSVSCAATLDGGVTIGNAQTIKLPSAAGTVYALDKVFTGVVGTGGTTITTFPKADLKSVKYDVTLVQGTNVTAFEIIAAYNGTAVSGSVYAIADAQDDSQLDDVEITSTGTTIDLVITSASNTTTATIFGKAKY